MRILHVLSTLNIGSGIANFAMSYYRKLADRDIQFDFLAFCRAENGFEEEVQKLGGKVYYIEKLTAHFLKYKKRIKQFFSEHRGEWEIVHIHEILVQKFIAKTCKRIGGVKKVAIHSHVTKFVLPNFGVSAFKNKLIMGFKHVRNAFLLNGLERNCDILFACSEDAGKALYGKKALKSERFHVVKNAIDPDKYLFDEGIRARYRDEFRLEGKKVIIQVGRLCEEKNQTFFLDVMQKLCEADNSYTLLLVGKGELKGDLEEKIAALGLGERVILTGNRRDVANLFQCADLSVLPSLAEGLGIALIEAQASGLPCIASTGVPQEANITPYVRFLDLNEGAEVWADAILNTQLQRYETRNFVTESGYDVRESAERLGRIYSAMVENC